MKYIDNSLLIALILIAVIIIGIAGYFLTITSTENAKNIIENQQTQTATAQGQIRLEILPHSENSEGEGT